MKWVFKNIKHKRLFCMVRVYVLKTDDCWVVERTCAEVDNWVTPTVCSRWVRAGELVVARGKVGCLWYTQGGHPLSFPGNHVQKHLREIRSEVLAVCHQPVPEAAVCVPGKARAGHTVWLGLRPKRAFWCPSVDWDLGVGTISDQQAWTTRAELPALIPRLSLAPLTVHMAQFTSRTLAIRPALSIPGAEMKAAGKGQAVAVSSPLPSILIRTRRKRHTWSPLSHFRAHPPHRQSWGLLGKSHLCCVWKLGRRKCSLMIWPTGIWVSLSVIWILFVYEHVTYEWLMQFTEKKLERQQICHLCYGFT